MTLPTELDFAADPAGTPARMNRAMDYIVAKFRALEAIQPEFASVINELKAVGLERLAEALVPIFEDANAIDAALKALQETYEADEFKATQIAALLEELRDGVPAEFDTLDKMAEKIVDYRSKYLGAAAVAPTLDDNGNAITAGALYFDTVLTRMRVYSGTTWGDAGSAVDGILERQDFTATGGETSVTVPGGYDPGNIIVYVNGSVLAEADVVVTSGTSIGLPAALGVGDVVSWTKFGAVTLANVYTKTQADARYVQPAAVYLKAAIDTLLAAKANQTTTYTKTEVDSLVAAAIAAGVPTGSIHYFARTTAPAGYLACSGQTVARTTYANLFALVGTEYNVGGESGSDFRLPDLRGEFIRGWDNSRGVDTGRVLGSAQGQMLQDHFHSVAGRQNDSPASGLADGAGALTATADTGGAQGATVGTETRPRNVAFLACIRI